MTIDRANALLMIKRALKECFPDHHVTVMREVESRLPLNGRSYDGFLDGPPWWKTEDGRYLHLHDMTTEHLTNTLALINRSNKGRWRKRFIKPIEKELAWRTG